MQTAANSRRSARWSRPPNELQQAVTHCKRAFFTVAAFSAVINLLMLAQPIYMLQVYDRVLTTGHYETLIGLTLIATVCLILLAALDGLRSAMTSRIGEWLNDQLGPVFLASSVRAQLAGQGSGGQSLRDLSQIQSFISTQGLTIFFDFPWVPFFVFLLWLLHPLLGLMGLVSAILLLSLGILNEVTTRSSNAKASARQIEAQARAEATVRNAEAVTAMGMLPALVNHWRTAHRASLLAARRSGEISAMLVSLTKFVRFFVQISILCLGAMLVLESQLTAGGMIAASILLGRALAPVEHAITAWRNFTAARLAYERLKGHLEAYPAENTRMLLPEPAGHISVQNMTYYTPDTSIPILRGISFEAKPGEMIAVVGPSGAGKSTLCRLIVGLGRATTGKIRIDGSEIGHWSPLQLGRHIGYLPQDVELFAGTVRENIARMTDASDEDVVKAAMLAHAHDVVQKLPSGYDTQIGEGGARLSGGQRQRIGLARAIFGDPKLIILDEPNANLDTAGESALSAALGEVKAKGAVILVVGHRPSTLAQADKILLLRDGRVEVFGPRDEVLQKMRKASSAASGTAAVGETGKRASVSTQSEVAVEQPPQIEDANSAAANERGRGDGTDGDRQVQLRQVGAS